MSTWVAIVGAAALLCGGFLSLRPLLIRLAARAAARDQSAPVPDDWRAVMLRLVPATHLLPTDQQRRLLESARELIATRHWEGCGGLTLTLDMQLAIAVQACRLVLALPGESYPELKAILVYPHTFVPRQSRDLVKWLPERERVRPELGEAWSSGTIVLAWDSSLAGGVEPSDGHNVVYHEFAHALAFQLHLIPHLDAVELGLYRGVAPLTAHVQDPTTWARVLSEGYERLCARIERREPSALDPYGATNLSEFFAVATEAFFERAAELRASEPELYDQLAALYRQDPATTHAALGEVRTA